MRALLGTGPGLEVGVGTGRFAAELGLRTGLDPSLPMARFAARRGVRVVRGVGERLPFRSASFRQVLFMTALGLVEDPRACLSEAHRVLRPRGILVAGFVDRLSPLGLEYAERGCEGGFYARITFFEPDELATLLEEIGFRDLERRQAFFQHPEALLEPEPFVEGSGEGSFVLMRGVRA